MMHFHREQTISQHEPITSYSPIIQSLLSSAMDPAVRERVKRKFDISMVIAKEHYTISQIPSNP